MFIDEEILQEIETKKKSPLIKQTFLKRQSKTYGFYKLKWNTKPRVNCWNKKKTPEKKKRAHIKPKKINLKSVKPKIKSKFKKTKQIKQEPEDDLSFDIIRDTYIQNYLPKLEEILNIDDMIFEESNIPQLGPTKVKFNGLTLREVIEDKHQVDRILRKLDKEYKIILNN